MMTKHLLTLLILSISQLPLQLLANDVDSLLRHERPAGVVFEIITGEEAALDLRLGEIRRDIERLREKFPDLPVAIVSHGGEQFAMTTKNADEYPEAHDLVRQFVGQDSIDFHVCGTHAGWYGVTPEDFPEYVDVSTTGPAQINDYEALGYELIVIDE